MACSKGFNFYVILKKVINLLDCFYDPSYPQLMSKLFLCRLTDL